MTKVELTHYVCGECGYTESYIEDPKGLKVVRSKFTQL
jgi:predicted nucleic-acid-binding Zn-ribbon protein